MHHLAEQTRLDSHLGAHLSVIGRRAGARFAVIAPNAARVSVIGDFNDWDEDAAPMQRHRDDRWSCFVPGVDTGALYKFRIHPASGVGGFDKADPLAFATERPPRTASRVWDLSRYRWQDDAWMATRGDRNHRNAAVSIYEVHLGSWMRDPHGEWLTYRAIAHSLANYTTALGFTHVELLPITEHPFDGSWGYQTLSYYAPTSRHGTPDDFMYFVDTLHRAGVGVLLDWVPGHFPDDAHGLCAFDGAALFEHRDPRQQRHPDWDTLVFDLGNEHTATFLIDSALFWLDRYHVDGFRVDAVASMLYLDYSRGPGEWTPNAEGGHENHDAVQFLRRLNERVHDAFPDTLTVAEESTAWPLVSHSTARGGLGFDLKWNMGWMHDLLAHMSRAPDQRATDRDRVLRSLAYAGAEHFVLALSHDEVVHGKGSLHARMPGTELDRFADLRLLYGWMFGHPGKKLLFMGNEFGQQGEWQHDATLAWDRLAQPLPRGLQRWIGDLNRLYRSEPALYATEFERESFAWVDRGDRASGIISLLRRGTTPDDVVLFVCNFTSDVCRDHVVTVPFPGLWRERLNSDAAVYGGANHGNLGGCQAIPGSDGRAMLSVLVPPRATLVFTPADRSQAYTDLGCQ